jgi:hypothetical protein
MDYPASMGSGENANKEVHDAATATSIMRDIAYLKQSELSENHQESADQVKYLDDAIRSMKLFTGEELKEESDPRAKMAKQRYAGSMKG